MRRIPQFKEPLIYQCQRRRDGRSARFTYEEFEEGNQTDQAKHMGQCSHDRREFLPRRHHRSEEEGDEEQGQQDGGVPDHWTNSNDTDTNKRAGILVSVLVWERLDEHVSDDEYRGLADWPDDFREQDRSPVSTRDVSGQLLRGMTKLLLLVTSNHRPRETAVSIPAALVRARITS